MGAKQVAFDAGASADIKDAVAWYQKRSPKAALDFIDEVNRAVQTIADYPERWPIGANRTRRFLLWRFPFALIYSVERSEITIWAVAHGSRRPGYWADRLL